MISVLNDKELTLKEKAKAAAPSFIPSGVAGFATTGLIFLANILGAKQQSALAAGMAYLYKTGRKNRYESEHEADMPKGVLTFYEPLSKRYFKRTMEEVLKAEYHLNRNFILRGYAPLNEFYEFLGLEKTDEGEKLGWSGDVGFDLYGYAWIDFEHCAANKDFHVGDNEFIERDCLIIYAPFAPTKDYLSDPYDM